MKWQVYMKREVAKVSIKQLNMILQLDETEGKQNGTLVEQHDNQMTISGNL